jgi:AmmeMemoRadiSam system protein B
MYNSREVIMRSIDEIRPSPIAGYWYSANPKVLRDEIQSYLNKANLPSINGEVIGLVAPHAGYRYSGQTAAYSFKTVLGESYDLVVLLSPFHQYHPATILCSAHDYYQTPLGKIKVDQEITNLLINSIVTKHGLDAVKIANDEEHSLEIELPFLQCVLDGDFDLLPIMVRSIEPNLAQMIANSLIDVIKGKKVLIVSSTDLSHFYPKALAEKYDQEMLSQIKTFSVQNVYQTESKGEGFACGLGAVMIGIATSYLLGADKVEILHHSTSGDVTGDFSSVVGYGSVVFLRSHL